MGILAPILACTRSWLPEGEKFPIWFQRSGSILVIFAIMSEFILLSLYSTIYPGDNTWTDENHQVIVNKYKTKYNLLSFFSSALAIIGTIIWGYGDIIIKNTVA